MKRILSVALFLALLPFALTALAEGPAPIDTEDILALQQLGFATVADYADAFSPSQYTWDFEGEATGITAFTLSVEGGSVSIHVADAVKYQDSEQGLMGAYALEGDVLSQPAFLSGVYWENESLTQIPIPRGLKLGDAKQQLQSVVGGLEFASLEPGEFEEEYDETASYTLVLSQEGSEWQEYYGFDFFLNQGILSQVEMIYYTDAE